VAAVVVRGRRALIILTAALAVAVKEAPPAVAEPLELLTLAAAVAVVGVPATMAALVS
jgi:hypothetical protein